MCSISWIIFIYWIQLTEVTGQATWPPCLSQLGLRYDAHDSSLKFTVEASSGVAEDIRMNGPRAWTPEQGLDSKITIAASKPLLLTALQIQTADEETEGIVREVAISTSFDCIIFRTENYSVNHTSTKATIQTIFLSNAQFVSCLIIAPLEYSGPAPSLRIELLGCVLSQGDTCSRGVHPVADEKAANGGRVLRYEHSIVLTWLQIEMESTSDSDGIELYYSKSCENWTLYDSQDIDIVSVVPERSTSKWITMELGSPIRTKCLMISPLQKTVIQSLKTNTCGKMIQELHQLKSEPRLKKQDEKEFPSQDILNDQKQEIYSEKHYKTLADILQEKFINEKKIKVTTQPVLAISDKAKHSKEVASTPLALPADVISHISQQSDASFAQPEFGNKTYEIEKAMNAKTVKGFLNSTTVDNVKLNAANGTITNTEFVNFKSSIDETSLTASNLINITTTTHTPNVTSKESIIAISESKLAEPKIDNIFKQEKEEIETETSLRPQKLLIDSNQTEIPVKHNLEDLRNNSISEEVRNTSFRDSFPSIQLFEEDLFQNSTALDLEQPRTIKTEIFLSTTVSVSDTAINSPSPLIDNIIAVQPANHVLNSTELMNIFSFNLDTEFHNEPEINQSQNNYFNYSDTEKLPTLSQNILDSGVMQANDSSKFYDLTNFSVTAESVGSVDNNRVSTVQLEDNTDDISNSSSSIEQSTATVFTNTDIPLDRNPTSASIKCGIRNSTDGIRKKRVISGYNNFPGEWPWLVSMHFLPDFTYTIKSGYKHACGASLIHPRWVLTAGHCFSDAIHNGLSNISNWRVKVGMHDLADTHNIFEQERLIHKHFIYPTYNIETAPLINDIAILQLDKPVEITERSVPVCLDNTKIFFDEAHCYVSGWGNVFIEGENYGSRFPKSAILKILTLPDCGSMFDKLPEDSAIRPYVIIQDPVMCASVGPDQQDACQGDSGGPLMCEVDGRWHQVGIVAAGSGCGNKEIPALYSRIAYFYDWIKTVLKAEGDEI